MTEQENEHIGGRRGQGKSWYAALYKSPFSIKVPIESRDTRTADKHSQRMLCHYLGSSAHADCFYFKAYPEIQYEFWVGARPKARSA